MRMPVRHMAGNVVWTRHGTVWAVWRVEGEGQAHASYKARLRRLHALEALVKRLHGESMWLSLCPQVDPYAVVRRMTEGVNLAACPRYEELGHRVLDELEHLELTARTDWLAVPLSAGSWRQRAREVAAAGVADMATQLGLMPAAVGEREERRRLEQAEELAASWPATVRVRAASEAEIFWIYGHATRRGVLEPLLPEPDAGSGVRGRGRGVAAMEQTVLAQGGVDTAALGEEEQEPARQLPPAFRRRWVQVSTEWGSSYQGLLCLAEMPDSFAFPGSEYLAALDDFSFPVDWVARLSVTSGARAEARTRRKAREVAGQPEEYAHDPAGVPATVSKAQVDLPEFRERVTASSSEVEVRAMVTLCVWGDAPSEVEARAAELSGWFEGNEYALVRPVGEQERLWYGMLPGSRTPPVMLRHAQTLLARDFCMAGPFTGSTLGDERGPLFGLQVARGGVRPVLMDFARGPRKKTSASAAFIGELGAGKSTAMKAAVWSVLASGRKLRQPGSRGRAVMVDRTPRAEWVSFARACPGSTQVITVDSSAQVSLDPLRLLTRTSRGEVDEEVVQRRTETFLSMLLGLPSADDEAALGLSEAIEAVLESEAPSMAALITELERGAAEGDATARVLARKLRKVARSDMGRVFFDPELPVVDAEADSVVFSVPNLRIPTQRELEQPELFRKLPPEKVFGRAALWLIAALCEHIAVDRADEFTVVVWDECWWLTQSPEGQELLLGLIRDGRKNNAAVFAGSHDAHDIGPDSETGRILRGLIPRRFLFRQTTDHLARRGLEFLGLPRDDASLLELVTSQLSPLDESEHVQAQRAGECLSRDLFGRIGEMRVLIPFDPAAAEAIHSDPGSGEETATTGVEDHHDHDQGQEQGAGGAAAQTSAGAPA